MRGKILQTKFKKKKKYPFIVHGCAMGKERCSMCGENHYEEDPKLFPTHTHGLIDIEWPEFIINARCFGPSGNTRTINNSYDYFLLHPEKLESILNGEVFKISEKDLSGESVENLIFCYRLIDSEFIAVKMAYEHLSKEEKEKYKFIQIWINGDDFALKDGYYLTNEDRYFSN